MDTEKLKKNSTPIMYAVVILLAVLSWLVTGNVATPFLFAGIFHLLLYTNITVTTITNIVVQSVAGANDNAWRMICMTLGSLFLAIGIALL